MNHLQIYDNALPKESCRNIIKYFDNHPNTKSIIMDTNSQVKQGIRNETDMFSYSILGRLFNALDSPLSMLMPTLDKGITDYKKKFPFLDELSTWGLGNNFNIQKFNGEEDGYFIKHCEADGPYIDRMLTWMIYLNNAKCGTRFYHPRRDVKAKEGRLVIWPAGWTHPHSGITPNKGEKYLMTGWWIFSGNNQPIVY